MNTLSQRDQVARKTATQSYRAAKRTLDIVGSALLLLGGFPVMLVLAVLVKMTSPGPILFRQVRLGNGGRRFMLLKFRTMVMNAEQQLNESTDLQQQFEASFKIANDPRITRIGAILRRTSLDELPQIMNVLLGQMSLVGPRPIVPAELQKYGTHHKKLLTVKPGLAGLWQASGRSETTYEERIALDMHYIDCCSFWMDLSLLLKTTVSVLTCRGAF